MRLALNPDKTFMGVQKGVILGSVVSENGKEPDLDKIAVTTPINAKGIAKLLAHVGCHRELILEVNNIAMLLLSCSRRIVGLCGRKLIRGLLKN